MSQEDKKQPTQGQSSTDYYKEKAAEMGDKIKTASINLKESIEGYMHKEGDGNTAGSNKGTNNGEKLESYKEKAVDVGTKVKESTERIVNKAREKVHSAFEEVDEKAKSKGSEK